MVYRFFVYLGWRCGLNRRGEEMYGISSNKKLHLTRWLGSCRRSMEVVGYQPTD